MYGRGVAGGIADARPGEPGPSWREHRVRPRHAPVWVRAHGAWRKGRISAWVAAPGSRTGWECVIEAEPSPGDPPWQGRYVYDPKTIRPRYSTRPPAELMSPRMTPAGHLQPPRVALRAARCRVRSTRPRRH